MSFSRTVFLLINTLHSMFCNSGRNGLVSCQKWNFLMKKWKRWRFSEIFFTAIRSFLSRCSHRCSSSWSPKQIARSTGWQWWRRAESAEATLPACDAGTLAARVVASSGNGDACVRHQRLATRSGGSCRKASAVSSRCCARGLGATTKALHVRLKHLQGKERWWVWHSNMNKL